MCGKVFLLAALACLALSACGPSGVRAPVGRPTEHAAPAAPVQARAQQRRQAQAPLYHTVVEGETLYAIAWRYGVDYRDVAAWNGIDPPYTIYPSQRLRIRAAPRRTAPQPEPSQRAAAPAKPAPAAAAQPAVQSPGAKRETGAATAQGKRSVNGWHWPARGKLLSGFSGADNKGVNIGGKLGQPVYAAADGRVVYSGGGLIGYGELIIVKHNDHYLSAYAHNNKLLVKEGDSVKGGQHIAEMGRSGTNRVMLHFEIRRDGKPVDPLSYLPR